MSVDTPFSLVDGCLFAQLVDLFDKGVALGLEGYSKTYEQLWKDIRSCVDRCHKDGVIKLTVAEGMYVSSLNLYYVYRDSCRIYSYGCIDICAF